MNNILDEDLRETELPEVDTHKISQIAFKLQEAERQIRRSRNVLFGIAGFVIILGIIGSYMSNSFLGGLDILLSDLAVAVILMTCAVLTIRYAIAAFSVALVAYVLFELFSAAAVPQSLISGIIWKLSFVIFICGGLYNSISAYILRRELNEAILEAKLQQNRSR